MQDSSHPEENYEDVTVFDLDADVEERLLLAHKGLVLPRIGGGNPAGGQPRGSCGPERLRR